MAISLLKTTAPSAASSVPKSTQSSAIQLVNTFRLLTALIGRNAELIGRQKFDCHLTAFSIFI